MPLPSPGTCCASLPGTARDPGSVGGLLKVAAHLRGYDCFHMLQLPSHHTTISHSRHVVASWEGTGHGPGTWPSGHDGDAASAGVAGVLHSASPCGLVHGHQCLGDDVSWGSNRLSLCHLWSYKTKVIRDRRYYHDYTAYL